MYKWDGGLSDVIQRRVENDVECIGEWNGDVSLKL